MEYDADSCTSSPLNMSPPESFEAPNASCSEASLATSVELMIFFLHEIPRSKLWFGGLWHLLAFFKPYIHSHLELLDIVMERGSVVYIN